MHEKRAAVRRFLDGQRAAAHRQRDLMRHEGPRSEQSIAEFFSVLNLLAETGGWPGRRDPVAERDVRTVRKLWARVKKRSLRARAR